jgi:pimeloyl-ACP methyl ester carboxylesterase
MQILKKIKAGVLEIAYAEHGPQDGTPVFLMHGFPYDIHATQRSHPFWRLLVAGSSCLICVALAQPGF